MGDRKSWEGYNPQLMKASLPGKKYSPVAMNLRTYSYRDNKWNDLDGKQSPYSRHEKMINKAQTKQTNLQS